MREATVIKNLLQNATEGLLQSASIITKYDRSLQSSSDITKCDSYCKVRRNTRYVLARKYISTSKEFNYDKNKNV